MLFLKSADGRDFEIIHSQEGVTQGNLLAMIAYDISFIPMIRILQKEILDVFQPWYADDGADMVPIPRLLQFFDRFTVLGPKYGYFPEESKSILIV